MGLDGFQSFVLDIASSKVPTAAAVHGACPAGGTVLALATDYKITAWPAPAKFSMGLNETRVGLAPPLWLHALARLNLASPRIAETVIQLGTLYNDPYEAQKLGFLDTVLENASLEDAEEVASARLLELASIPWEARVAAKLGARAELLALLRDPDESIVDCIVGDEFQRVTGDLLVSLKKNK
ncbi:dodecenoyl-CoA isomerase [Physocladia obscura]|uniref:Dodecenoyl-CoA isomerase n=1 Tax=Physocladia obscura TaxID=109957 RepID=A0AAD5T9J1_9FUNG|nr:dodecenoyl-CoA isomerase [Physocladia obscura]